MNGIGVVTAPCIVQTQVRQDQAEPTQDRRRRDGIVKVTEGTFGVVARNRNIVQHNLRGKTFFVGPIVQGRLEVGGQVSEESVSLVIRTPAINARHLDALQGIIILGGLETRNRFTAALQVQGAHVKPFDRLEPVDVTHRNVNHTMCTLRFYANRFHVETAQGATVFLANASELNLVVSRPVDDRRNGGSRFVLGAAVAEHELPLLVPNGDPAPVHVGFQLIGGEETRVWVAQFLQNSGATVRLL